MNKQTDWIETRSGKQFWLPEPSPYSIKLSDIAHGLSLVCRFGGQCKFFYSVAQHSINTALELKDLGQSERLQLLGLLHDASEAYICDIPRPLKQLLPEYKECEDKVMSAIYQALKIDPPELQEVKAIKLVDDGLLGYEASVLMPCHNGWHKKFMKAFMPMASEVRCESVERVELKFLDLAERLILECEAN